MAKADEDRDFTVTLSSIDGVSTINANLQANEDAAQPPSLKEIRTQSTVTASFQQPEFDKEETHIILSTGSGHQKAADFFEQAVEPILKKVYSHEYAQLQKHVTQSATTILDLTRDVVFPKANGGTPLRIILASGDGGIVDLVNGLSSRTPSEQYVAPKVVLLPLGTANALYHSINPGASDTWGLPALSSRTSQSLPVFTATFSPGSRLLIDEARQEEQLATNDEGHGVLHGAVVCSWGMHASLVADSDTTEYRKYGIDRFKMAAKEALYPANGSAPHPYKAAVSVLKDNEWTKLPEDEHMYVLATMVSNLEKPFCISPATKPLDVSMHLIHFGPRSGDDAMTIMGLAYAGGKHVEHEDVRYEKIDGFRIEFKGMEDDGRWRRICVDGKIVRVDKDGWVEVRRGVDGRKSVVDIVTA